jgi:hypothetical protein
MWTSKNRGRYDRSKLRYPSDLTDDEWKLIELLIVPGKPGGGKRTVIMRDVVNGLRYVLSTGCQCARSRKTCHRKARSTTISIYGPMAAHWSGSTTRFMSSVANKPSGKPVRPPPSSTARARKAPKKGGLH